MKALTTILLFAWLLLLFDSCNTSEDVMPDVNAEILKEMEARKIPSVVACVVKDGHIVWEAIYGNANVQQSKPPTRESLYMLMSISKLVLATAAMQLWEQGLLDLEADINQYLPFTVRNPRFPDERITPAMLLTHSSGLAWPVEGDRLPDFHHFYSLEEPPLLIQWLPEYILPGGDQYRESVWKDFAPGTKWLYSNIGTSLLALIVEQISGEDYRDYCATHILEPLEMDNSGFWLDRLDHDLMVTPYTDNNNPMQYYTCRHYPAGFLGTNIEDFSHFMMAFLNGGEYQGKRILQHSTIDKMLEIQNPASGLSYLWWHCLGDCYAHDGGGTGFRTFAEWHFDDNSGLFIFSNKVNESVVPGGRIYDLVRYQASTY